MCLLVPYLVTALVGFCLHTCTCLQVLGMFIFDIILYTFLAWYFGQVLQSEWGTNRPWYFLLTKTYWRPAAAAADDAASTDAAMKVWSIYAPPLLVLTATVALNTHTA